MSEQTSEKSIGKFVASSLLRAELLSGRGIALCAACKGTGLTLCMNHKDAESHLCDIRECPPCRGTGLAL